ncbi:MAG TPA: Cj0069 family protein [Pyrinomonadaceae bacterium]|nr:Cj0069 family protein [Pyrinomonadaceae bacterium]
MPTVGIMLYSAPGNTRDVFVEEKYRALAETFVASGLLIETILYNDTLADSLRDSLKKIDALLVWVNPIEQGHDRKILDQLLAELADAGVYVSSHPETIMKIGTKDVLFKTRNLEFGSDVEMYETFDDFQNRFPATIMNGQTRVLKRFRGNGGEGVFKVRASGDDIFILHAKRGAVEERGELDYFENYFTGPMLNQEWNDNIENGMVRCYMSGKQVAGFGYQEINALYPQDGPVAPGRRFYFTEKCALFSDLRTLMEERWVDDLLEVADLAVEKLPVIWDADFFINSMVPNSPARYTLCEINVSSVSPFPESAIGFIVNSVRESLSGRS